VVRVARDPFLVGGVLFFSVFNLKGALVNHAPPT
jgi:hypothetical protein